MRSKFILWINDLPFLCVNISISSIVLHHLMLKLIRLLHATKLIIGLPWIMVDYNLRRVIESLFVAYALWVLHRFTYPDGSDVATSVH